MLADHLLCAQPSSKKIALTCRAIGDGGSYYKKNCFFGYFEHLVQCLERGAHLWNAIPQFPPLGYSTSLCVNRTWTSASRTITSKPSSSSGPLSVVLAQHLLHAPPSLLASLFSPPPGPGVSITPTLSQLAPIPGTVPLYQTTIYFWSLPSCIFIVILSISQSPCFHICTSLIQSFMTAKIFFLQLNSNCVLSWLKFLGDSALP